MLHKCNRPIYIALLFLLTLFLLCDYIPALHFFTACIPKVYKTYVISSAQFSARENFFLKNTASGKRFYSLPACSIITEILSNIRYNIYTIIRFIEHEQSL